MIKDHASNHLGRATILNIFMQYTLHQTNLSDQELGFSSFIRLIGTSYFKSILQLSSQIMGIPHHYSFTTHRTVHHQNQHRCTATNLHIHWLHACWVHQMQQRSIHADIYFTLPPPENSGWAKDGDNFVID